MTARHPTEISSDNDAEFDAWLTHIFDHEERGWWWPQDAPSWDYSSHPATTLTFLTRLFKEPAFLLRRYSHRQIDVGFSYLVSASCSSYMWVLCDNRLPWNDRREGILSMISLYKKLFAPLYGWSLGHSNEPENPDRPNFACYMWWDVIGIYGGMDDPDRDRINDAVLSVMEQTLTLKEESCLESALHGLGHWEHYTPDRVHRIIERFLAERFDISDRLRAYAVRAAEGMVQ